MAAIFLGENRERPVRQFLKKTVSDKLNEWAKNYRNEHIADEHVFHVLTLNFYICCSVGDECNGNLEALQFNLAKIEAATKKFSCENRTGKGGFGEVYKVKCASDFNIIVLNVYLLQLTNQRVLF